MSTKTITSTVSFQYGDIRKQPEPQNVVTLSANGNSYPLEENTPPISEPNISLFSLNFGDSYYPLYLYFDGQQFSAPQLTPEHALTALAPLPAGQELAFVLYHQSDPTSNGTVIIDFTVSDNEIGVLIVGTGGLTDPKG